MYKSNQYPKISLQLPKNLSNLLYESLYKIFTSQRPYTILSPTYQEDDISNLYIPLIHDF